MFNVELEVDYCSLFGHPSKCEWASMTKRGVHFTNLKIPSTIVKKSGRSVEQYLQGKQPLEAYLTTCKVSVQCFGVLNLSASNTEASSQGLKTEWTCGIGTTQAALRGDPMPMLIKRQSY
jgi:hypothetical protein